MPKFQIYEQQTSAPGPASAPRASGEDLGFGKGLVDAGTAAQNAGEAVFKRQQMSELSTANAAAADFHAKKTVEWQDTIRTADPNDPHVADKFLEKYDQDWNAMKEKLGLETPKAQFHIDDIGARTREHFLVTSKEGQAALAGVKAKADFETVTNSNSSTVLLDPTSYAAVKANQDQSLRELVKEKNLPQDVALKLQGDADALLAKSTLEGWIRLNPEYAKEKLKSKEFDAYLNGEQKFALDSKANEEIRAKAVEQERLRKEQERVKKEEQEQTQNDFLAQMIGGKLTTRKILDSNLEAFGSGSKHEFINMLEKENRDGAKDDPYVVNMLFNRVHLPDGDPRKITDSNDLNSYFGRGIGKESLAFLRGEVGGLKTPEGKAEAELKKQVLDAARNRLTKSNALTGIKDPIGDQQYMKFVLQFNNDWSMKKKAGVSPVDMVDPNGKESLWNLIPKFERSFQDQIKDMTRQGTGGAPADGGQAGVPPGPAKRDPEIEKRAKKEGVTYEMAEKILTARKQKAAAGGK